MTKKIRYILRSFKESDDSSIIDLMQSSFGGTTFEQWTWKYKLNPNFDPNFIIVAEKDGEIIGFLTTTIQNLKISRSIMVRAMGSPAEILVHPNYRKLDVGKNLTLQLFKVGRESDFVVSYGVASPEVSRFFWARVANAVSIPTSTVVYTKLLSLQYLNPWISKINKVFEKDKQFAKIDLAMLFRLKGIPTFTIRIYKGKLSMIDHQINTPNIIIESTLDRIRTLAKGRRFKLLVVLMAILTGDLRVKGILQNIINLYRCARALVTFLRGG